MSSIKELNIGNVAEEYLSKMIDYTCLGGKMNRGLIVISTLKGLKKHNELTQDDLKNASILGWCIEYLQAFFLVADDIMDQSKTRRGKKCWYLIKGLDAINDSFLLENVIYKILKKYFKGKKYYVDLLELFIETTHKTEIGQLLDLISPPSDKETIKSKFSLDLYKKIVKFKTAYYSFSAPVYMGILVSEINFTTKDISSAERISLQIGEYFQIQDDYLDCYGDPKLIGKIGRDIQEKKCCWLIVKALELANTDQLKKIESNYGKEDESSVKIIKQIYQDLNLKKIYQNYENCAINNITKTINSLKNQNIKQVLFSLLKKIQKRDK